MNPITRPALEKLISEKRIEHVDLSEINVDGLDFSGCHLENVIFCSSANNNRSITDLHFNGASLKNVFFDHASLLNISFDSKEKQLTQLEAVSFARCELTKSRFRNTRLQQCDLRYAEFNSGTFEKAQLDFCDLYRTFFIGIIIFRQTQIKNCSLKYAFFDEGAYIRRDNLAGGRILQQNAKAYRSFLIDWHKSGLGTRKNDQGKVSDWSPQQALKSRFEDAEEIYKTLNGLWQSKGFYTDANWAYVMGKKMELYRMIADLRYRRDMSVFSIGKNIIRILWNAFTFIFFGYGESLTKMVLTYLLTVIIFAYFYMNSPETGIAEYFTALAVSFKNMVAMTPDHLKELTPFIDLLNLLQTSIGILLTGIFGFILGNKIRNQ